MKISKVAASTARRLFGLCQTNGSLDETKMRAVVSKLTETKPRDYLGILGALQRLIAGIAAADEGPAQSADGDEGQNRREDRKHVRHSAASSASASSRSSP